MNRCYAALVGGLFVVGGGAALADSAPTTPPKPPTYYELQVQNYALQELLNTYRARALMAEDKLAQQQAQDDAKANVKPATSK